MFVSLCSIYIPRMMAVYTSLELPLVPLWNPVSYKEPDPSNLSMLVPSISQKSDVKMSQSYPNLPFNPSMSSNWVPLKFPKAFPPLPGTKPKFGPTKSTNNTTKKVYSCDWLGKFLKKCGVKVKKDHDTAALEPQLSWKNKPCSFVSILQERNKHEALLKRRTKEKLKVITYKSIPQDCQPASSYTPSPTTRTVFYTPSPTTRTVFSIHDYSFLEKLSLTFKPVFHLVFLALDPFKVSVTGNNLAEVIQSQLVRSGIEINPGPKSVPHGRSNNAPYSFQCEICSENEMRNKGKFNRLSKLREHMKKHHNYSADRAKTVSPNPLMQHRHAPSQDSEAIDIAATAVLNKIKGPLFSPCVKVLNTQIVKTAHSIFNSLVGSLESLNTLDYLESVGKRHLFETGAKEKALKLRQLLISHALKPETGSTLEKRKDAFGATAWTNHLEDAVERPYNWVNKDIILHSAADLFKVDIVTIVEGDVERIDYAWYSFKPDGQCVGEVGSQVFVGEIFIPSRSFSYFLPLVSTGKLFETGQEHRASPVTEDGNKCGKTEARFSLEELHEMLRSILDSSSTHGYLSGAVLEEAWEKKGQQSQGLLDILKNDKLHIRNVHDGGSVFNSRYEVRLEDQSGCLPEWETSHDQYNDLGSKENNETDAVQFFQRPSAPGDSIHTDRMSRFKHSFIKWELTEQGEKPVPEAKRTEEQMVDIFASDPEDLKEILIQMDIQFRNSLADLDRKAEDQICDPGRWSENDEKILQDFEKWVNGQGREGKLAAGGIKMKATSTPKSYGVQVKVDIVHLRTHQLFFF